MILHIVLYQPKASATVEKLSELARAIEIASREIPCILRVRVGKALDFGLGYKSWVKDRNNGSAAVFEFEDKNALETYLLHPSHRRLGELFWELCEETTIVDVSAVDAKVQAVD